MVSATTFTSPAIALASASPAKKALPPPFWASSIQPLRMFKVASHKIDGGRVMLNRELTEMVFALLLLTGAWSSARAQQPVSQGPAASQTGWMFNFAPYLWLPTAHVTLNYNLPDNLGARLPTDLSSGPGDYLSKLDAAAAFAADVRKGPFSLLTDFMFTRFSAGSTKATSSPSIFSASPLYPYRARSDQRQHHPEDRYLDPCGWLHPVAGRLGQSRPDRRVSLSLGKCQNRFQPGAVGNRSAGQRLYTRRSWGRLRQ